MGYQISGLEQVTYESGKFFHEEGFVGDRTVIEEMLAMDGIVLSPREAMGIAGQVKKHERPRGGLYTAIHDGFFFEVTAGAPQKIDGRDYVPVYRVRKLEF